MNVPITTLIFDCFGVILAPVVNGWYKNYTEKTGFVDPNLPETLRKLDMGLLSEEALVQYFSTYEGNTATPETIRKEIDANLVLDEELVAFIRQCREGGFKIALLSNANNSFFERKVYPTYPEFKALFDTVVVSSVVGMVKPNADIYLHCLAEIESRPEEALFIDDSQVNVDAAIALGMQGYLYTDATAFRAHMNASALGVPT